MQKRMCSTCNGRYVLTYMQTGSVHTHVCTHAPHAHTCTHTCTTHTHTHAPHTHAWQVEAAGVNRLDLLQAHGKYPPPPGESEILGVEGGMCTQFKEKESLFPFSIFSGQLLFSLVPRPHPLTGLVNQVEFLGLVFSLIPRPHLTTFGEQAQEIQLSSPDRFSPGGACGLGTRLWLHAMMPT